MVQTALHQSFAESRLSNRNLHRLPENVITPAYDRAEVTNGIVHIGGASNFFRSHLAVYMDDLMNQGQAHDFGIYAVSMRNKAPVTELAAQDGLYTVESRATGQRETRIIGAVREIHYLPDEFENVLNTMAAPQIKMYSMTVTQPGYCQNTKTGDLDTSHPDIVHDLASPTHPRSAIGLVVEGLNRRFQSGGDPVTILSCDNLPENSRLLERMVSQMAAARDPALAQWIEERVAFPVTTVDRIAPVTTDEFRGEISETTGLTDARPVLTEPFRELVIENKFAAARPPFEDVGVKIVQNPEAFWSRKFKLLNTGHTLVATVAQRIGGVVYIDEAIGNPSVQGFVRAVMNREITPALPKDAQPGIEGYKDKLIDRFSNTELQDRVDRVGAEGSRKVPKYVFSAIKEGLHHGTPIDGLSTVAAAWIHGLNQQDEKGRHLELRDPKLGQIADMGLDLVAAAQTRDDKKMAEALDRNKEFFGPELANSEKFRQSLMESLVRVGSQPMESVMDTYIASGPPPVAPRPTGSSRIRMVKVDPSTPM